jgi:beta-glucanase (GH16 family)
VTAAAVTLATASVAVALHAQASVPPTTGAGWNLTFSDDFAGAAGSGVSGNWRYTTGTQYPNGPAHFGTDEIETMTANRDNVALDGSGNLRITALNNGGNWTSGRIETNREDFQPPAGGKLWVESRLQMPNVTGAAAAGYWPAFWMLGTPYRADNWSWPRIGEIDIMENVNGINREWGTFHCGVTPGGPCGETTGRGNNVPCVGPSCQSAFHTFAIQWDRSTNPQTIKWYLDGVQFHTVSSTDVDATTWANATNHGFFILLNLAMGGQFPAALGGGPTAATASGKSMLVDYVAVWSGGAGASGSPHAGGGPSQSPTPTPPTCGPLVSQGKPTTSSAVEAANLAAQYAVDGNLGTRWSSTFSDPQWMQVDLGSVQPITRVKLSWEAAYASAYQVQVSNNAGGPWTVAYDNPSGAGGVEDLKVTATARYVRLYGTQRATPYGYSLWELQVYGGCGSTSPSPSVSPSVSPSASQSSGPPPGTRDAYGTIQAESANQLNGLTVEACGDTGGGQDVATGANGDSAVFANVDFGSTGAHQFIARAASGAAGGVSGLVEVRLDSPGAAPIGSFAIANTGGWQSWRTVPANISGVTGVHTVYVTFTSGQPADYASLNWISFGH